MKRVPRRGPSKQQAFIPTGPCCLVRLPTPVLTQVLIYYLSSYKDLVMFGQTCKTLFKFLKESPMVWFTLSIHLFPEEVHAMPIKAQHLFNEGTYPKIKWKEFFLKARAIQLERSRQNHLLFLESLLTLDYHPQVKLGVKHLNLDFLWRSGTASQPLGKESLCYQDMSVSVCVSHTDPPQKLGELVAAHASKKLIIRPELAPLRLVEGGVDVEVSGPVTAVKLEGKEIYWTCWTVNYLDIIKHTKSLQPRGVSLNRPVSVSLNLRTTNCSLYTFHVASVVGTSRHTIELPVKESIPTRHFQIKWNNLSFSGQFMNLAIIDCAVRNSRNFVQWVSGMASFTEIDQDMNGKIYALTVNKPNNMQVQLLFRRGNAAWKLFLIKIFLN